MRGARSVHRREVAIGLDVGGTELKLGAVRADGRRVVVADHVPMRGPTGFLSPDAVAAAAARFAATCGVEAVAVGMAVAAAFDAGGAVAFAPNLAGWVGTTPALAVERATGRPAYALYDGHAALEGEAWLGAARGLRHAILLVIGTGVGGAVLAEGRVVGGADGLAGVFGYLPVAAGPGAAAPLESLVGGPALAARLSAALGREATTRELFGAAASGTEPARSILDQALEELGVALAGAVSILNPELVILGGGLGAAFASHGERLEETMRRCGQPVSGRRARVVAAALGNDAGWLGAARVALRRYRRTALAGPSPGS